MKITTLILTIVALMVAGTGLAKKKKKKSFKRKYGMAGCGLGSVVIGARGAQISAGTTNGTFWNQTFGITFGTLNCIDSSKAMAAEKVDRYLKGNTNMLAIDMVRGQGEHIDSVADILGCSDKNRFQAAMKSGYHTVFPESDRTYMQVTDSVISVILNNNYLMKNCRMMSAFS